MYPFGEEKEGAEVLGVYGESGLALSVDTGA